MRLVAFVGLVICLVAIAGRPAWAHMRSVSWSSCTLEGDDASVRVRVSRSDLSAHPRFARLAAEPTAEDERALDEYLEHAVRAEASAGPCPIEKGSRQVLEDDEGFLVRGWRVRCPAGGPVRIATDLLFAEIPSHLHFAALVRARPARDSAPATEHLLTRESPSWEIGGGRSVSSRFADFVALGVRHVATGLDHIVFVLVLLAGASSLRAVAGVVTGFTLGHSATLALAVLGGVRPDVPAVESLVGASIAVVAVENVWLETRDPWMARALVGCLVAVAVSGSVAGRSAATALAGLAVFVACYHGLLGRLRHPARLRWTVAALFGTVHGLAFSGALAEMHLPRASLAGALLGFNVGVEIAQLAIVALAWPLWRLLDRLHARPVAIEVMSAAALGAGAFWLIGRAFGAP